MRKKPSTIYDIAQHAGVSVSTVSRVLNGRGTVNPTLRERVERSMHELRFRPNRLAQNLYHRHSNTLGCILPDISSPYFASLFLELEQYAFDRGYTIVLGNTTSNAGLESTYLRSFSERQVDGLLFLGGRANHPHPSAQDRRDVQDVTERLPVVAVNGDLPGVDLLTSVSSDEAVGTTALLRHLRERGHERVAFLGGDIDVTTTLEKLRAYRAVLPDAPATWTQLTGLTVEAGDAALSRLLDAPELPTAVLCVNDMTAAGVLRAARRHGLRVPEDLSVVGFDDTFVAQIVAPALTTVNHNYALLAQSAVDALLRAFAGHASDRIIRVPTVLVERESVAPPRPRAVVTPR